jgi:predicted dehydrogenase
MSELRILLIGLGSIGKRHARLIQRHFSHKVVALRTLRGQERNDFGIPELNSWAEAEAQPFDVAFVTNPTNQHIETALRCAERGLHLFIEKPIDCRLDGLERLVATSRARRLSAYVAYPLRHHPLMIALKERLGKRTVLHASMVCASYLPQWRPQQDYRKSHACFQVQGGGVLLEMSHELDMAEYLFGPVLKIEGRLNRISDLTTDSDDCADLILRHGHGITNVHLNLFSRQRRRFVEVDTADGFLRADLVTSQLMAISQGETTCEDYPVDSDLMYLNQLRYFFDHLGHVDFDNSLARASGLFTQLITFRNAQLL